LDEFLINQYSELKDHIEKEVQRQVEERLEKHVHERLVEILGNKRDYCPDK